MEPPKMATATPHIAQISASKPLSLRVYAVVFYIIGFVVALEAGLEFRASRRGFQTHIFGAPASWSAGAPDDRAASFGPTDDFPFRSRIVPRVAGDDVTRIWIASASYAEDNDIRPNRIFPVLLDSMLVAHGWPVEVLNAAKAGHVIATNRERLREQYAEWEPDLVLLYQMSLDINELSQVHLGGQQSATLVVRPEGLQAKESVRDRIKRFFENTTLYELVRRNITNTLLEHRVVWKQVSAPMDEDFRQRVTAFVEEVRALGAEPVLCTFAMAATDAGSVTRADEKFLLHNSVLHPSAWPNTVARWNDMIREIGREMDVAVIEVAVDVGGQRELFKDITHFTQTGHRRVAESMSRGLEALLAERRGNAEALRR